MKRKNLKSMINNRKNANINKIPISTPVSNNVNEKYESIISTNIDFFLSDDTFPINDIHELNSIIDENKVNNNTDISNKIPPSKNDKLILSKLISNNNIVKSYQIKIKQYEKKINEMKLEDMKKNMTIIYLQNELKNALVNHSTKIIEKNKKQTENIKKLTNQIDLLEDKLKEYSKLSPNQKSNENIVIQNKLKEAYDDVNKLKMSLKQKLDSISYMSKTDIDANSILKYSIELKDENDKLKKSKNIKYMESLIKSNESYKQNMKKLIENNTKLSKEIINKNKIINDISNKSKLLLDEHTKTLNLNSKIIKKISKK